MVRANKGNPPVDFFFFVLQEVISVNFTGLYNVCGSQCVGESVQPFNKRMNGHRSDLTKKTLLPVSQHFVSPGHSLEDFVRSKIYIIDHNTSWKRAFLDPRVTNITSGGHTQNGLNLLFFNFLTSAWSVASL
jgi:hypothetical protein